MRKNTLLLSIIFLFPLFAANIIAQEKWSFKLSYGLNNSVPDEYIDELKGRNSSKNTSHFRFETNYNLINNFYTGFYLGYSKLKIPTEYESIFTNEQNEEEIIMTYSFSKSDALYYGLNFSYQLLPLFTGQKNLRFELYPTVKLGFVSEFWKEGNEFGIVKYSSTNFEYGIGAGAAYKITQKFGVFGEVVLGDFYNDQRFRFHVGAQINF